MPALLLFVTHDLAMSNQARTFVFNADSKQRQVLDANRNAIGTDFYDGEGKRVKKVTDTETTVYVYSSGKLIAEYSTATPPADPTVNYTATDMLGSPRVLTNSLGEVVSRRDFLPFGEELYADGQSRTTANKYTISGQDTVRKRFTGYEKDPETQLDFAEARMYENRYGRFTAVDPLLASGKSASPQTFNRYVYVMNNPLSLTDPTGLQASSDPDVINGGTTRACEQYNFACHAVEWVKRTFSYGGQSTTVAESVPPFQIFEDPESFEAMRRKQSNVVLSAISPGTPSTGLAPYGTAEEVARVENAINTIDQTGLFNMLNTGYKQSTGRASKLEYAGSILNFASNFIPAGKTGKTLKEGGERGFTRLFRAIGENELDDVLRHGDYGLSPHQAGKYFTFAEKDMINFANTSINSGKRMTYTFIDVPTTFISNGQKFFDPGGAGRSIHFADDVLVNIYQQTRPVQLIEAPWVRKIQ